jgi:hypothetical protein
LTSFFLSLPRDSSLFETKIKGIVQQFFIVRADIEHNWQHSTGVNASCSHVQAKFANLQKTKEKKINKIFSEFEEILNGMLTGIPIPLAPKSPRPKILLPSVTTTTSTSRAGQL